MNFFQFLVQGIGAVFANDGSQLVSRRSINSRHLKRKVALRIYRPPVFPYQPLRLLVVNDGQDLPRMQFRQILKEAYLAKQLAPTLVVGLVAGDRIREYGTSERPDYQGRGDLARAHELFVTQELIPWLESRYSLYEGPKYRATAGFSLGGLNAFDLAWRNPEHFGSVGVFSGALWWRSKAFRKADPDADRIVHHYVEKANTAPAKFRAWLMAGTEDEKEDRNNNGIIDAIDDTVDLANLLKQKGIAAAAQLCYFEVPGGKHEPQTWGKAFPHFLTWWNT